MKYIVAQIKARKLSLWFTMLPEVCFHMNNLKKKKLKLDVFLLNESLQEKTTFNVKF